MDLFSMRSMQFSEHTVIHSGIRRDGMVTRSTRLVLLYAVVSVSTLALSGHVAEEGIPRPLIYLPNHVAGLASVSLYLFFVLAQFLLVLWLVRNGFRVTSLLLFLPAMYFLPAVHAVAVGEDQLRYLSLFLLYLAVPVSFLYLMQYSTMQQVLSAGRVFVIVYLAVSTIFVALNFGSMNRLAGFQLNPNGFGMILFFSAVLFFTGRRRLKIFDFMILFFIAGLVALTGSRVAMASFLFFCSFMFFYSSSISKGKILIFLAIAVPIISVSFFEYFERALRFTDSFTDSGRGVFRDAAIPLISQQPLLGQGADAPRKYVGTGNLHSSYLRFALMFGLPVTVISYSILFAFLIRVSFIQINHSLIKVPLFAMPILFLGEDFAVGIATPFFVFICFFIALLVKDNKETKGIVA